MKVLIVGAGVVGTIYGWALSGAGHDVIHAVRSGRARNLANGVALDMFDKRPGHKKRNLCHYDLKATESLGSSDRFDIVIVPTHHYELVDALRQYAHLTKDDVTVFVLLTQNWQGTAEVDSILPQTRYLFADAKAGGTFRDDVLVSTLSSVDLGIVKNGQDQCLTRAVALFESAGLKPMIQKNMLHYLWVQYAISGGMWPSLVRAGSMDAVLKDHHAGELAMKSTRECLDVVARRGVNLKEYPETRIYYGNRVLREVAMLWMKFMFGHDEYMKRSSAHALQNAREIRAFYYDLVNTGQELGVDMPTMLSYKPDIERFEQALIET